MVGSFPWRSFSLEWFYLDPVESQKVKGADSVVSLFIGTSTSEEEKLFIDGIIVQS